MLTPEYLDTLPDALVALWQTVEDDILRDIARRIGKLADGDAPTETAAWQLWRFQQTQALHQDVVRLLAKYSGKSDAEIRRILQAAGAEALAADDALYQALGFSPSDINSSPALLNLLNAGYRQTAGTWKNLTATTANTVTRQFEDALDRAWLQTSSGAFDYKTAVKRAVDGLAADGLKAVTYPSGHTDTLEVAVRRAVLTGVNQTAAKLQLARAEEMGCAFVEVTAHGGARSDGSQGPADHAWWQGKVYHIGGDVWRDGVFYPDFATATGYGTGEGLCGWNCRHNFFPFWPGISKRNYTDAALQALNARDIPYHGKLYTRYEISQMQRALERRVRSAKRTFLAEDEAGLDTGAAAAKLKAARQSLAQFVRDTGGRQDSARESVSGFGRSAAGKANAVIRYAPARESRQQFRDNVSILPPIKGDAITHRSVYNALNRSEIGRKTLEWINSGNYNIEINYTDEAPQGILGRSRGRNVVIYANNTHTVKRTTETLIHEITHAHYDIGGSQWAEAQCVSAEYIHRKGSLTISDLRDIIKLVKEIYPELPWR